MPDVQVPQICRKQSLECHFFRWIQLHPMCWWNDDHDGGNTFKFLAVRLQSIWKISRQTKTLRTYSILLNRPYKSNFGTHIAATQNPFMRHDHQNWTKNVCKYNPHVALRLYTLLRYIILKPPTISLDVFLVSLNSTTTIILSIRKKRKNANFDKTHICIATSFLAESLSRLE